MLPLYSPPFVTPYFVLLHQFPKPKTKLKMALTTATKLLAFPPNKNTNNPSIKLPVSHSFPLYKPPAKHTLSISHHHPLSLSAISSSQEIGSFGVDESTIEVLDKVQVFDLEGNGIPITDLWKDRKTVVAFARHFGCVLCRKRADYLVSKKSQMDAAGVALALIGPGSIDQAKAFYDQTKFAGEVYADPDNAAYAALRFVSGVSTTFTPKAGLKIIQLYKEGYRQDWELSFQKDTVSRGGWQQGGIIVAGPGKTNIAYIHKDKEAGDDPPIEDVLRACCSSTV